MKNRRDAAADPPARSQTRARRAAASAAHPAAAPPPWARADASPVVGPTARVSVRPAKAEFAPTLEPTPRRVVTQDDLHDLEESRRWLDERRNALSRGILDRLEGGAVVEPGPYGASVKTSRSCRPTLGALEQLCGKVIVRDLRERLGAVTSVRLRLRARLSDGARAGGTGNPPQPAGAEP